MTIAGLAGQLRTLAAQLQRRAWALSEQLAERLSTRGLGLKGGGPGELLSRTSGPAFYIGLSIVVLGLLSGLATYLILTGLTAIQPTNAVVVSLLLLNIALVLAMAVVVGLEVWRLVQARRKGAAGARLHVRIVALFSLIAVLPAITLAVFSSASLNRALDRLFSRGIERIITNSMGVAQLYLQEHGQVIRADIVPMAKDLADNAHLFAEKPKQFETALFAQATLRNLPAAYVIDGEGKVLAASPNPLKLPFNKPTPQMIAAARGGEAVFVPPGRTNQVGAIQRLDGLPGVAEAFLYVQRDVNAKVLNQLRLTETSVQEYIQLKERSAGTQLAFGIMHLQLALTLLLASVWMGMWLANKLVSPIRRLIAAAIEVSTGNLDVRVPFRADEGDLGHLSTTFNRMTEELRKQHNELVSANDQLNERRRFIEAVLSGVSAGVIGLDDAGAITLANPSALALLGKGESDLVGVPLATAIPQFATVLDKARQQSRKERLQEQVQMNVTGDERHFALQVVREHSANRDYGFVLTFDDITGLVTAQRSSAWADVARRIAHEIKNPLTPIQLSAERLRRKYGSVITADREVFDRCTETIIRQVGDLGRIVDEFSSFARMPKAQKEPQDVREVVREVMFLFQNGNPDIDFVSSMPEQPVVMACDRRLIGQAVTNLVKNATEAIGAVREEANAAAGYRGRIEARVAEEGGQVIISIIDNGCGLPKKDRARLTEPYMTTRAKGTGIGLAVVQKVAEQHGGTLRLEDASVFDGHSRGAAVSLVLPATGSTDGTEAGATASQEEQRRDEVGDGSRKTASAGS